MSINLIIISRFGNSDYINHIKDYNLSENVNVIYPTDTEYETKLIIPYLNTNMYNLIIYDWSTTISNTINQNIQSIMGSTFDVMYLGKYLDTCTKYSVNSNVDQFSVVSGTDPIGFNAVLITPGFTSKLITKLEETSYYSLSFVLSDMRIDTNIVSLATSPNLFVYNPLYNTIDTSKSYNVKTEECQGVTSEISPPVDNNLIIFWIIIIVIIVCIVLWLLLNFTSFGVNTKYYVSNKDIISY